MKRVIKFVIAVTFISALPNTLSENFSNLTAKAYASETTSVYLKDLSLNKSDIDFDQDTYYYDAKVDKDVDEIKITAKPKDDNATVSINNDYIDENDNYKKVISLDKGNNIIRIKVTNDEDYKIYTLNILRGEAEHDEVYLNNINLSAGSIDFSKEISDYDVNVGESVDRMTISAVPGGDMSSVTIDGANANKEEDYKQTVNLNKGKNPILIKVENNNKDKDRTYILYINREDPLENKENQDDIYLDYFKVDNTRVNIDKDKTVYDLNLSEDTSQIDLTAEPEKTQYKVKINNKIVEDMDDYKDTVSLKPGKNKIIVKLQDEVNDKQRIYTLNINVGAVANTSASTETSVKFNQWVLENNKWKYVDSSGNFLKNTWFYDKNTNKNYYLQTDGSMAAGWLLNNGHWYYLDSSGVRKSGWINDNGEWYYLDSEGIMQTGWIRDLTGKYYYLQVNGTMAKNTQIDGYKLGNDGAWIN
ncbi:MULTISPECIES: cadherin-like beta sandwich domain-containing protein [unclassified Clostridium]|uniref:N-acetylmuramoyl-L-alanine amidase family protein n=1 Tax=unclassified Clostridium TaxID=2614128 RepID=UPI00029818EB|nr:MULTISPECIES: cadherin-like beta sandwich domain-containing protein [unclassified Clostridium]EKQ50548.1 MAG: putative cell wall binding protein [Clostridium sp. Maddingley MBC34-26]